MKNLIFLCCLLSPVLFSSAQVKKITLQQSVQTAITNNLEVKQSGLRMESELVDLKQSRANQLPDLFGNVNHGINQGRSIDPFTYNYTTQQVNYANYSLSTNVTIFNGLQLWNSIKQNALGYKASKLELQQLKDNITLNVILTYLQILTNEDQLAQSKNQAEVTRKQVERLEILNKAGAITPALYYDLKGQLANDELSLINNRNTLDAARLALTQLMNVPFDRELQLEDLTAEEYTTAYDSSPDQIYEQAVQQLSLVRAADLRRQSAEKGVKVARGALYPRLILSGGLFTNYSSAAARDVFETVTEVASKDYVTIGGSKIPVFTPQESFKSQKITYRDQFNNNYNTSVSLGLQIPIVNAFRARNQISLAKIDLRNAQYIAETNRIRLKQSIEQAYFNMNAGYERYKTLTKQVADYGESFRSAEVRFNAGATTQVDYLIAKNNLDRANNNLIIAKYDYVLRRKVLDYYQGKLAL